MDDCYDGFYTCLKRDAKFPSIVYLDNNNNNYNVEFTGTPPASMRFRLRGDTSAPGMIVNIKFPNSDSYSVFKKGESSAVEPNGYQEGGGRIMTTPMIPVAGVSCGENNYEGGAVNRLTFYITPGNCDLTIGTRNVIQLGIRLEFTVQEFFDTGGPTLFVARMAAVLGIHFADLRVVRVYQGSTVVEFEVFDSGELDEGEEERDDSFLSKVLEKFETEIAVLETFMGSVVLNAVANGNAIVTPNTPTVDGEGNISIESFIFEGQDNKDKSVDETAENIVTKIVYTTADTSTEG